MAENQELWEDCPHSSAPLLRAPFQLVQQEIWGLCLLFLALAEVVSVAEDTGAAARGPAGAGTVQFQVPRSHLIAAMGNILILANTPVQALHVPLTLLPYFSDPKQSSGVTFGHTQLGSNTVFPSPPCLPRELTTVDTNMITNC